MADKRFSRDSVWARSLIGLAVLPLMAGAVGVWASAPAAAAEDGFSDGAPANAVVAEEFSDIAEAGVHRENVKTLRDRGVMEGTDCAPGHFCPNEPIQRWVMAVWLIRALEGADPSTPGSSRFEDVDHSLWWSPFVERLADLGITRGCSLAPAQFCPTHRVTRQQMASFLARAFQLAPGPPKGFADVEEGDTHTADINALAAAGITAGCSAEPVLYCPTGETTRGQMATFLARALGIDKTPPSQDPTGLPKLGLFTAVSVGWFHSCGLLTDGTVVCWGDNAQEQAEPPPGSFISVSSGREHSCAVNTDQHIICWGATGDGRTDPPQGPFTIVASGGRHSCGIRADQGVSCWGANDDGQASPPSGEFLAVGAGDRHTCGLRADRQIICWGDNSHHQAQPEPGEFVSVAVGHQHSCGLRASGLAVCWGGAWAGQTQAPAKRFSAVAAGWQHSCGITTVSTVVCWGYDESGSTRPPQGEFAAISLGQRRSCGLGADATITCWGAKSADPTSTPAATFTAIAAGYTHGCGLGADHTLACWGSNAYGQASPPEGQFADVAAGTWHSCAVRSDLTLTCWGSNWEGTAEAPEGDFTAVAAGWQHSCAIRSDRTITCWGGNRYRQQESPPGSFMAITAGDRHSCALRTEGSIICWGDGEFGQTKAPSGQFTALTAGPWHSCALRTQGSIACWGSNWAGKTEAPSGIFAAVAAGSDHSCGVRSDGTLTCWGADDGGASDPPRGRYATVVAGRSYSCGLRTDRTLGCWGRRLVIPVFADVQHYRSPLGADLRACQPPGVFGTTAGFPLPALAAPSIGTARVAVLFMDFPDAIAAHSTQQEAELGTPHAEKYLEAMSRRRLDLEFIPLHRWLRAEQNHGHYLVTSVAGGAHVDHGLAEEAIRLSDSEFDFTDFDTVMVVLPSTHFGGGVAGGGLKTEEGSIPASTLINNHPHEQATDSPMQWGLVAAHELVHNLGLSDLYPYDAARHRRPDPPVGRTWIQARYGLMGLSSYFLASRKDTRLAYRVTWPNGDRSTDYVHGLEAAEMLAWSRWQLGWLDPARIHCLVEPRAETTVTIGPAALPGSEKAMIAIPVADTEVIVIESRRKVGYDAGVEHRWPGGARTVFPALADEGVLVYTVNASLGSGDLPVRMAGDPGNAHFQRNPILKEGQSITVSGYTITVSAATQHTDTITITKDGSP